MTGPKTDTDLQLALQEPANPDTGSKVLRDHANAIRELSRHTIENVIEIGRHLAEARDIAGHGGWLPWLQREFRWGESTARRFIQLHELGKSVKLEDLNLPVSTLYLLAAPSTPKEVRDEVIARSEAGEVVSAAEVKGLISDPKKDGIPPSLQVQNRVPLASPTFVGKVRAEKEATGDVSTADTRIDTKGRKQPARKSKPPIPRDVTETAAAREDIGPNSSGEVARKLARLDELEREVRRLTAAAATFDPVAWWNGADKDSRRAFLEEIKLEGMLAAMPQDWRLRLSKRLVDHLNIKFPNEQVHALKRKLDDDWLRDAAPAGSA